MVGYVTGYVPSTKTLTVNLAFYNVGNGFQAGHASFQVNLLGLYRSNDNLNHWQWLTDYPTGATDSIVELTGDGLNPNKVWITYAGSTGGIGYRIGAL